MIIPVMQRTNKPVRQQLAEQLGSYASSNDLKPGHRLPSVRAMAQQFGVGHVTMAKFIRDFAEKGYLETNRKGGTLLTKNFPFPSQDDTQYVVMISNISYSRPTSQVADATVKLSRLLCGMRMIIPSIQFCEQWFDEAAAFDRIDNIVNIYNTPALFGKITYILSGAFYEMKEYFQKRNLPAIVLGAAEEGITLPTVNADISAIVRELTELFDKTNAYPVTYITFPPVGEHFYYLRAFEELNKKPGKSNGKVSTFRLSYTDEIYKAQLRQLLNQANPPRTIIAPGYIEAVDVIKIAQQLGIKIPEQLQIICLDMCATPSNNTPAITGYSRDFVEVGTHLAELIRDIRNKADVANKHILSKPVLVFRDTFIHS